MKKALSLAALLQIAFTAAVSAQSPSSASPSTSIALEADVLAYGLDGFSVMGNLSFAGGFQVALGTGSYDVPSFLLRGDANYDRARWKATSTSVQVLRMTYRFNGPMRSGPALGGVVLNQNWRLRSETLGGESDFRPLSVGLTGGYYVHLGKHLYLYPTAAFTYNAVVSGEAAVNGTAYRVARFGPNASLHMGWETSF